MVAAKIEIRTRSTGPNGRALDQSAAINPAKKAAPVAEIISVSSRSATVTTPATWRLKKSVAATHTATGIGNLISERSCSGSREMSFTHAPWVGVGASLREHNADRLTECQIGSDAEAHRAGDGRFMWGRRA